MICKYSRQHYISQFLFWHIFGKGLSQSRELGVYPETFTEGEPFALSIRTTALDSPTAQLLLPPPTLDFLTLGNKTNVGNI